MSCGAGHPCLKQWSNLVVLCVLLCVEWVCVVVCVCGCVGVWVCRCVRTHIVGMCPCVILFCLLVFWFCGLLVHLLQNALDACYRCATDDDGSGPCSACGWV